MGFAPADKPQYAFAACVEGDAGDKRHSSETAVPLIGKVLREIYKDKKPEPHKKKHHDEEDEDNATPPPQDDQGSTTRIDASVFQVSHPVGGR